MKGNRKRRKEVISNTGLSVMFSEKALIALLSVVLTLGVAHLQVRSSVSQQAPMRVLQDKQS